MQVCTWISCILRPPPRKDAFVDELASPSSRRTSSKGATSAASFSSCAHSCEVKSRPVTWWVSLGFSHFWYKRFIKLQFQWGKWGFITILNPPTLGAAYFHPISCWRCSQAASFPIFLLLNLMIVTLDFVQVAELILIRKGPHKESTWGGMNLSRSHCIGPMLGLIRVETTYRAFWKLATPWSSQIGHSVKGKPGWWKRDKKGQPNSSKHQSICPKFYSHFSCRLLWPFW